MAHQKKIYRSREQRIIFGVCGGLAKYFQVDPILIRLLFLLLTLGGGSGFLIYIILAVITPLEPMAGGVEKQTQVSDLKEELENSVHQAANKWPSDRREVTNTLGLVVIAIGVLTLVSNYFSLHINWSLFLSLAAIMFGLVLIAKQDHKI